MTLVLNVSSFYMCFLILIFAENVLCLNVRHLAVARTEWIDGYRRTGYRGGALEIVNLKTGKVKGLTSKLVSIENGIWK